MSTHASASTGKTRFYVDLCIPFGWSGAPAHSQLVLREIPASEDVFLTHPWREDYSPSSCSSTILSSSRIAIVKFLTWSTRKIFMTIPEQYLCVHTCVHVDFQKFTQMVIYKNRSLAFFPLNLIQSSYVLINICQRVHCPLQYSCLETPMGGGAR